jgi:hypothetical protein
VDVVAVWSLDRFGRSLAHVCTAVQELHERGVAVCIGARGTRPLNGRRAAPIAYPERARGVRAGAARRADEGGARARPATGHSSRTTAGSSIGGAAGLRCIPAGSRCRSSARRQRQHVSEGATRRSRRRLTVSRDAACRHSRRTIH